MRRCLARSYPRTTKSPGGSVTLRTYNAFANLKVLQRGRTWSVDYIRSVHTQRNNLSRTLFLSLLEYFGSSIVTIAAQYHNSPKNILSTDATNHVSLTIDCFSK